jgi:hypothetical protein
MQRRSGSNGAFGFLALARTLSLFWGRRPSVCWCWRFIIRCWGNWSSTGGRIPDFSRLSGAPLRGVSGLGEERDPARTKLTPAWSGIAVMALGLVVLLLGVYGSELFLSRVSLIILLAGLVLALAEPALEGVALRPAGSACWPSRFRPSFNQITFPLQILASKLASGLLPLFGVPVLREGNIIELPLMKLEVAEACSGIRSLMSLFTLAVFYGYFMEKSTWRRTCWFWPAFPSRLPPMRCAFSAPGLCVQYWDPDKALGFFTSFPAGSSFWFRWTCLFLVHRAMSLIPAKGGRYEEPSFLDCGLCCLRERRCCCIPARYMIRNPPSCAPVGVSEPRIGGWNGSDLPIDQETRDVLGNGDFLERIIPRANGWRRSVSSSAISPPREPARPFILRSIACPGPAGPLSRQSM